MALSSHPTLNWSVLPNHYHGTITSPCAAGEAPQHLTATALPSYSNVSATASCAHSVLNNKGHGEVMKADPSFFIKGCYDYGISHDAELTDDYCYLSYPDYCNHYNTYTYDDMLDPAAAYFFSPAIDPLTLGSNYEINDLHQQQKLSVEPGFLSFHDNYGLNFDQFYHSQLPPQLPKRHKPCFFDCPDSFFAPNNPHPPVQLSGLHTSGVSSKLTNVEDMDQIRPRTKRVSAQSLAARERRKKIANKTQELGKLIPGGSKMNTAEMLQSAFNYVKFLQSQVHILQLISSLNPSQVPTTPKSSVCLPNLIHIQPDT